MNWEATGAIAELAGAIGVIASLVYLAGQVRASTRAASVAAKLDSTDLLNKFIDVLINDPQLNDIYMRGINDLDSLSREEYFRFSNMALKAFWFFSAGYYQYRRKTIDDDEYHETLVVLRYWLRGAGCRSWWERLGRSSMSPSFASYVDAQMQDIVAASRLP